MISSKLSGLKPSIIESMSSLAREEDAIDMAFGVSGFPSPQRLIDLAAKFMKDGHNKYSALTGIEALREQIVGKVEKHHGFRYNAENEVVVTSGAIQAMYLAITTFIKEEDEVILFEPAADCYAPAIKVNGGVPVFVQLKHPDYYIDWNEVTRCINSRTKMIIINSPHNPTGAVLSKSDFEKLSKLVTGSNIIVLSVEVFEHFVFDGNEHYSVARFPKLRDRSIVVSSFGKTFNITGWKLGYCLAPNTLMKELVKMHRIMAFTVNTPLQYALADYMAEGVNYQEITALFEKKRDLFLSLIKDSKFKFSPTPGTFFQLLDYSEISDEKDEDFAIRLVKEFGVASLPISVNYHQRTDHKLLRFTFAKPDEVLERSAERLLKVR